MTTVLFTEARNATLLVSIAHTITGGGTVKALSHLLHFCLALFSSLFSAMLFHHELFSHCQCFCHKQYGNILHCSRWENPTKSETSHFFFDAVKCMQPITTMGVKLKALYKANTMSINMYIWTMK